MLRTHYFALTRTIICTPPRWEVIRTMTAWRYYSYLLCKRKQPSLATWLKGWLLAPHLLQTRRCRTVHRTVGLENERKKKVGCGQRLVLVYFCAFHCCFFSFRAPSKVLPMIHCFTHAKHLRKRPCAKILVAREALDLFHIFLLAKLYPKAKFHITRPRKN